MEPIKHLERLYALLRKINLPAEEHESIKESAETIARALMEKKAPVSDAPAQ